MAEGFDAAPWWAWELDELINWAKEQDAATGSVNIARFCDTFDAIYTRTASTYERQRIRNFITGDYKPVFELFGVTPRSLDDADEWNRNRDYNNRIKAAAADLSKAVEAQANPATVAGIVARLNEAQGTNTRDEWDKQLNETFAEELDAIKTQPDTLKTKWELGNITKTGAFVKYENIEYYPADISVFCAPTSHGKTMILFQSALDLIQRTNKTYLFVSCEENKRQLVERALNVYLNIDITEDGKTTTGEYCFIQGTRKKTIKAILRGDVAPQEYAGLMGVSEHYNALAAQVKRGVEAYGTNVRPRLKLIHTDANAESICANILHYVEEYRAQGVEVGGVFVDYMQLLTADEKTFSRHDELKTICKALKDCAARTELPIIIAAQLNRDALKGREGGIDGITVANIGEGADIERIAHDIYFVWQVDKTALSQYQKTDKDGELVFDASKINVRSNRLFTKNELFPSQRELKTGYLYVEQLKARDGKTDGWGLFPYSGERGFIGELDKQKMKD